MFKPFFLNSEYELEYGGKCLINGHPSNVSGDAIDVAINGELRTFERTHLCLYNHYRFNPFVVSIDNVWFAPIHSKVMKFVCGHLPVFKVPVEVGYGFRIIPGFSSYVINSRGVVMSYRNGTVLQSGLNAYGYPCVNLYDPDKDVWRQVVTHILLARSFIENSAPSQKIYVNHIDGLKENLELTNLEWVSPTENVRHAVETELTNSSQRRGCTVHDLVTGEKESYITIASALRACKIASSYRGNTKLVNGELYPRVYAKRYIITNIDEELTVVSTDSGVMPGTSTNAGPYQALNVLCKSVIVADTLKELGDLTNVPYDHVRRIVEHPIPKSSHGFHFRIMSSDPWPSEFHDLVTLKRRSFKLTHTSTGEICEFTSLKALTEFLSVTKTTVYAKLKSGEPHKGWSIREIHDKLQQSA